MKVYCHYEPAPAVVAVGKARAHSMIKKLSPQDTPTSVVEDFAVHYNAAAIKLNSEIEQLEASTLGLRLEDNTVLKPSQPLIALVREKDDLFIYVDSTRPAKPAKVAATAAAAAATAPKPATVQPSAKPTAVASAALTKELRRQAEEHFTNKLHKKARLFCEEHLTTDLPRDPMLQHVVSQVCFANEQFEKSVEWSEKAIRNSKSAVGCSSLDRARIQFHYARALFAAEQFEDAQQAAESALEILGGLENAAKSDSKPHCGLAFDSWGLRAECFFALGRHGDAASLVNSVMSLPQAESQVGLLQAYAFFALRYDKFEDAIRSLMKAVVLDQPNKRTRKLLGDAFKSDEAVQSVFQQVQPSERAAAAYAFLATIAKDYSAFRACHALLSAAMQLRPHSASYALNIVHNLELTSDYDEALRTVLTFCNHNRSLSVGSHGFSCGALYDLLQSVAHVNKYPATLGFRWLTYRDTNDDGATHEYCFTFPIGEPPAESDLDGSSGYIDVSHLKETLSDDALDLLALAFTAIKVLFLRGSLAVLPAVFQLVDESRRISSQALHLTSVRNEHAYYQCIAHVLALRTQRFPVQLSALANPLLQQTASGDELLREAAKHPIYVVGDSHVISPSWSVLRHAGKTKLLVPKLVTGIKHWHLRPNSDFYPKGNFTHTMQSIPTGSEVIFVIGEIDCREGILLALERDRYVNLADGMTQTIRIFIAVLKNLIAKKKLKVYVQPVLPVLNETRPLVMAYNEIYRKEVEKLPGAHWLDIIPNIVSTVGEIVGIRDDLKMDGTHIDSKYVSLLEQALPS